MDDPKLVEALNRMLAQEHACAIRYATHAAISAGPYSETVSARLKEIETDGLLSHRQASRSHPGALRVQFVLPLSLPLARPLPLPPPVVSSAVLHAVETLS
jgi:hypothetical protein